MTHSVRAIFICLIAYLCFDLMSIHVRYLSARYSAQELSVYRNIFGILPSIVLLWYTRELSFRISTYKLVQWKLALARGFFVAVAQLLFYTALGHLELATVSALAQTNAVFVVLLAVFMFREKVGFWRWGAVITGLIGAIWIVRPGTDVFTWVALLPIGAAFCYAFSVVSLRSFDRSISNSILYLYSAFAAAIGAIFFALFTNSFSPILSIADAGLILSMSIFGGFGVIFLMIAYRQVDAAVLAPFSYFGILTAFFFGWILFGEFPIDTLFPGVILIVGSGLVILWREQRAKE